MENTGEVLIYYDPGGDLAIEVKVKNEMVWLRQEQIADLFERDRTVITKHINNIFKENELDKKVMCKFCTLLIPTDQQAFIA